MFVVHHDRMGVPLCPNRLQWKVDWSTGDGTLRLVDFWPMYYCFNLANSSVAALFTVQ
jgi:hypothetical protein